MNDQQIQWIVLLFVCMGIVGCQSMSYVNNRNMAHQLDARTVNTVVLGDQKPRVDDARYFVPKRSVAKNDVADLTVPPIL